MKGNLGSEWEVRVSEGPGGGEAAAVHNEIYGARREFAAPGGKKSFQERGGRGGMGVLRGYGIPE